MANDMPVQLNSIFKNFFHSKHPVLLGLKWAISVFIVDEHVTYVISGVHL